MPRGRYLKDPSAVLDYSWDWAPWLEDGETIIAAGVTVPAGLTKESESNDDSSVTVWISGGTVPEVYTVTCEITTSSTPARTDQRSITIRMRER